MNSLAKGAAAPAVNGADRRALRVLGIDTSLRGTGVGIVEQEGTRIRGIAYDVLRNPPKRPLSACLVFIQRELAAVLEEFRPAAVAIEGVYFAKYAQSAMILGHARGVAIATCAAAAVPVYEYAPRRVKQAVVGYGAASKAQMQAMVSKVLNLPKTPPEDAADALALAMCHIQSLTTITAEPAKEL